MQGLCHDRSRRNTSCQVYCTVRFIGCTVFLSAPAGIGSLPLHHTEFQQLFSSLAVKTSARPPCADLPQQRTGACRLGTGRRPCCIFMGQRHTIGAARSYEICIKNVCFHILDRENSGRRRRNESICNVGAGSGRLDRKAAGRSAGRWTRSSVQSPFRRVRATSTRCLKGRWATGAT